MRDTLAPPSLRKRIANGLLNAMWSILWLLCSLAQSLASCIKRNRKE